MKRRERSSFWWSKLREKEKFIYTCGMNTQTHQIYFNVNYAFKSIFVSLFLNWNFIMFAYVAVYMLLFPGHIEFLSYSKIVLFFLFLNGNKKEYIYIRIIYYILKKEKTQILLWRLCFILVVVFTFNNKVENLRLIDVWWLQWHWIQS